MRVCDRERERHRAPAIKKLLFGSVCRTWTAKERVSVFACACVCVCVCGCVCKRERERERDARVIFSF